ncbi:MAG: hypothetical protein ACTIAG_03755 [Lactobacillus sp.]|nr:hypothetical protein [Lactobacillus sp.]MDN6052621.1 hypothetical protein [Lactobacillus sp.]
MKISKVLVVIIDILAALVAILLFLNGLFALGGVVDVGNKSGITFSIIGGVLGLIVGVLGVLNIFGRYHFQRITLIVSSFLIITCVYAMLLGAIQGLSLVLWLSLLIFSAVALVVSCF